MFENNSVKWKIVFFIAFGLSIIFTIVPMASIVLYPFRLFATFIHESFHVITSVITSGKMIRFHINPDASGLTTHTGGFRPLVIPAGYIGTAALGGLLIFFNSKKGAEKVLFIILGVFFLLVTLFFGLTNVLIITFGIGVGFLLLFIGFTFKGNISKFFLSFLAIQLSINSLEDLKSLIFYSAITKINTDAQSMSREVFPLPPIVWALIFAIISLIILYLAISKAFRSQKNKEIKEIDITKNPPNIPIDEI